MNERDVMALLAEANPVRVDEIPETDLELDSILARHGRPGRRLVLVAAVVTAAAAASLIGIFVLSGSPKHLVRGERLLVPPPTLTHPLPPGAKELSLADAAATLGAPVVLPDTSLVSASDAGAVWLQDMQPHWVSVAVTFPGPRLIVDYLRPTQYPESPLALYQDETKTLPGSSVVDLNGVPGLAVAQDSDQTGGNFGSIEFVLGSTQIDVLGHYDEAKLQAAAQSIVDQTSASNSAPAGVNLLPVVPPRKRIALGEASNTLGAAVVLPDASLVNPADAGKVWARASALIPLVNSWPCSIRVIFPSLTLIYERPAPWPRLACGVRPICESHARRRRDRPRRSPCDGKCRSSLDLFRAGRHPRRRRWTCWYARALQKIAQSIVEGSRSK